MTRGCRVPGVLALFSCLLDLVWPGMDPLVAELGPLEAQPTCFTTPLLYYSVAAHALVAEPPGERVVEATCRHTISHTARTRMCNRTEEAVKSEN